MEKSNKNSYIEKITSQFHGVRSAEIGPDGLWKILLWVFFSAVITIMVLGYLTYGWTKEVPLTQISRTQREPFSLTELMSIIDHYEEKELTYKALLLQSPPAPSYRFASTSRPVVSNEVVSNSETEVIQFQ